MTSTTGTDPHPEVAEISALTEGLLPPDRTADVRAHISGCALCTDVLDSLEEIRGLLGTLPGPQRMPADVAGRIDAALAAEALLDSMLPGVSRGTSPTADVPRETSTAPSGHADAPAGPGRSGPSGPSGHPGRPARAGKRPGVLRRNSVGLIAAAVALVLSGAFYQAVRSSGGGAANDSAASTEKQDRGAAAAGGPVESQVRELLAGLPVMSQNAKTPMNDNETAGAVPHALASVPSCVLKATQRPQPPLASGRELFQGKDAYLLVLPHPGDSSAVDAFVVNASCTTTSPGAVLFQATYPR